MNYHIEKLNEQTWLIEEYSNTASAYMYLLTGKEKALLIDTGFGTIPLKSICEELTVLPGHCGTDAWTCRPYWRNRSI